MISVTSNHNPFDLIEADLIASAIVELGRARRRMVRHRGGLFQRAPVLEVGRDPGRPKTVVTELGFDSGRGGAAADHRIGVRLRQDCAGELAGAAANRAEQRPLGIVAQARAVEIGDEVLIEVVVTRHRVPLAAFLVQPHPEPAVLRVDILDRHAERRANAGEGVDHQPDQRAVAQANRRCDIDAIEQLAGFGGIEHRRLSVGRGIANPVIMGRFWLGKSIPRY
jgi:hypothetical protein